MFMFRSSVQDFSLWMRYSRKVPGPNDETFEITKPIRFL